MRLDISVHDSFRVAEIQRLQELVDVKPHVEILELRVQRPEISVIDVLEYQTRCLALAVSYNIEKRDYVRSTTEVLQDLDLSLYLLLLNRLQDFDDAFLVVYDVDALEDLAVLPATCEWGRQTLLLRDQC